MSVLAALLLVPAAAEAQSAIAGVVKDTTGAVIPGVSVEASSPALIEKTRTVFTDTSGAYKIVNLRPGTYQLTFALPGFITAKREGIELPSNFTATINVELGLGTVEESVVVTGEAPLVDVQSNATSQVLQREVLDAVPTAHTIQSVGQLVVGVTLTAPDVGGSQAMQQTYFTVHGLGAAQTSVLMDGMIINGLQGDGAIQSYLNDAGNEEMVYQTGGGNVDSPTGGVKINLIPKEGGNRFSGSFFGGYESSSLQASNLTPFLASHGVKTLDKIGSYHDVDATVGGPIVKNKLWFFTSGRLFTVDKPIANTFVSDGTRAGIAACQKGAVACAQGVDPQTINSGLVRITWRISEKNKFAAYADRIHKTRGAAMSPGDDQTTASVVWNSPLYMTSTAKWTSTVTTRLLLEAGFSSNIERYNNLYQPGIEKPYGSAEWLAQARHLDNAAGAQWMAPGAEYGSYPDRYNVQAAATYVTGTHTLKAGFQDSWGPYNQTLRANADLYQNYNLGVPITVTLLATSARWQDRLNANLGIYGQDVWTLKRLTITAGGRWEYVSEQVTGQPAQQGRFANIPTFDDILLPKWKSFSPRTALVYDLFGNAKTAVRLGYNRYEAAAATNMASLYDPAAATSTALQPTASWTDLNHDDVAEGSPGCVYLTPGCEINFAQIPRNFGVVTLAQPDPKLKRPYTDQINLGVTHEVMKAISVSAEWFHNENRNILERNNVLRPGTYANGAVTTSSYRPVTIFSPIDGSPITMYDPVSVAVNRAVQNVDTNDPNLTQAYNAVEFNVNARLPHGIRVFGGSAIDRTVANVCTAAATNPNVLLYCDQSSSGIPWRTQFKLTGTVPLPWLGVIVSGAYQSLPGYLVGTQAVTAGGVAAPNLAQINGLGGAWTVTPSTRYAVCPGGSASQGCTVGALVVPNMISSSLSVPLVPPGTQMTPRVNQFDISVAKRLVVGRLKLDPKIDLFNVLNSDDYFSVRSTTYTPTASPGVSAGSYLRPGSILQGRILRLAAVVNW